MSLAYFLAQQGEEVDLFEAEDRLGGTCSWIEIGDDIVDRYYHVVTGGETLLMQIIRQLGIEDDFFPVSLTQGLFKNGCLYPATSLFDLVRFEALGFVDRVRMGWTVLQSALTFDWHDLDRITAQEWLTRIGGENLFNEFWRPIMVCKFGAAAERVVATDMWFRIRRIMDVMYIRNKATPLYIKGTFRVFFDQFAKKLWEMGVNIFLNSPVQRIGIEQNRVKWLALANGNIINAERIISTIPVSSFARLLLEGMNTYRNELEKIEYLLNISLILKTKKPISPFYQMNLGHLDFPFTGVIGADCMYPPEEYGGYITYITRYFQGQEDVFSMDAGDLFKLYIPFIKRFCPDFSEEWLQAMTISRSRYADILRTTGYARMIPDVRTPIDGLYLLSKAQIYPQPTLLDTAVTAARQLADQLKP